MLRDMLKLEPERVVLDVSHGINYMPILAYHALRLAAAAYVFLNGIDELEILYYNSDPVLVEKSKAIIHLIEIERLDKEKALETLYNTLTRIARIFREGRENSIVKHPGSIIKTYLSNKIGNIEEILEQAGTRLKEIREKLKDTKETLLKVGELYSSLNKGLPLYAVKQLYEFINNNIDYKMRDNKQYVEEITTSREFKDFFNPIRIGQHEIHIIPKYIVTRDIIDLYSSLILGQKIISEIKLAIGEQAEKISGEQYFNIKLIEDFANRYILNNIAKTIVDNELHTIKETVDIYKQICGTIEKPLLYKTIYDLAQEEINYNAVEKIKLIKIYRENKEKIKTLPQEKIETIKRKYCNKTEKCNPNEINERNFYAHAGLERNAIKILLKNHKIHIAYDNKCINTIEKHVRKTIT